MAPSKLRKAIGAVKDKTSIGLAKVGSANSLSELEVAIVKATRHEEYPAEEKHVREIISLTTYSYANINCCVNTISKRLNKTKNWTVALKTLVLVQRLLAEGDLAYQQEIFFSTRRGTRLLNLTDFRDTSHSNSWDYSAFVRTYALYLDERLEWRMLGRRGNGSGYGKEEDDENGGRSVSVNEMKNESIFSKLQHLQQLLERFLACRPTGEAKNNRVVLVALYPIVKESFQIYYDITEVMGVLIHRFMELDRPDCIKTYEFFCRASKQFDELDTFYKWCHSYGVARSSEYPDVEKITKQRLDLMDEFIRDKSVLAQRTPESVEEKNEVEENGEDVEENREKEDETDPVKLLPSSENLIEEEKEEPEKEEPEEKEDDSKEADLLNLGEDAMTTEEHGDTLALALFDGGGAAPTGTGTAPAWEAFADQTADWETALVQSASNLSNQKTSLGCGFDMLLLDGMYQQAASTAAMSGRGGTGSASSVAIGATGRPAMLALPAPPTATAYGSTSTMTSADPFAASLVVAPPPYVQMSEMEKKQKLLAEEQMMWQQYARDGMQGQYHLGNLQPNPYNTGGYMQS